MQEVVQEAHVSIKYSTVVECTIVSVDPEYHEGRLCQFPILSLFAEYNSLTDDLIVHQVSMLNTIS